MRIGIHLGEVIFENGDVFGDGVNVASGKEALTQSRQHFVSESVHGNLPNKKNILTRFITEEVLKKVVHDEIRT